MPDDDPLGETLEALKMLVQELGDEVDRDIDGTVIETGRVDSPDGFWAERGDHPYLLLGKQNSRFFTVVKPMSIVGNLMENMSDEEIDNLYQSNIDISLDHIGIPKETSEEEVKKVKAVVNWLDAIDDEVMEEIVFHLKERVASPELAYNLQTSEEGSFVGLTLKRKIFPYEDSFSIRELDQSIQAVISISTLAQNFIGKAFNIDASEIEEPSVPE